MAEWLEELRAGRGVKLDNIAAAAEVSPSTMRGLVAGRAIGLQGTLCIVHAVRRHNAGQLDLCEGGTPVLVVVAKKKKAKRAVRNKSNNVPHGTKGKGGRP